MRRLQQAGITVVGMADPLFPKWMTGLAFGCNAIPARDTSEGSPYRALLYKWEYVWRTLATRFPTVQHWEVGNEFNHDPFLHPGPCTEAGCAGCPSFSFEEKAAITTDLMYYAHRGLHAMQPQAFIFTPGFAPAEKDAQGKLVISISAIGKFVGQLYRNIASGAWPSTPPRDYFDGACWHPYLFTEAAGGGAGCSRWATPTKENWVDPNLAIHQVLADHGDGDIPVLVSEIGTGDQFTANDRDGCADRMRDAVLLAEQYMRPWLWGITWFRLLDEDKAIWVTTESSGRLQRYELDPTKLKTWSGTITRLRLDPGNAPGAFAVDYVRLR